MCIKYLMIVGLTSLASQLGLVTLDVANPGFVTHDVTITK